MVRLRNITTPRIITGDMTRRLRLLVMRATPTVVTLLIIMTLIHPRLLMSTMDHGMPDSSTIDTLINSNYVHYVSANGYVITKTARDTNTNATYHDNENAKVTKAKIKHASTGFDVNTVTTLIGTKVKRGCRQWNAKQAKT